MNKRVEVQCKVCGKTEFVFPSRAKKYCTCSVECLSKYNAERYTTKVKKICPHCHQEFLVKKSHANRRVYCSTACRQAELPKKMSGTGNPNYKGRTKNSDGYLINSKYTIHRETVMQILGVNQLPQSLIVHHKDGNKHNNNPHNLLLLPHKWHTWLHKNIGNYIFQALYAGKITVQDILNMTPEQYKKQMEYMLNTDCTQQSAVLKQGELLGSPI